jgi:hemoglobin-like flavoprotein
MTPQQVVLIQTSWQQVVPIREQAAQLFYDKLFMLDPSLQPLFKGDMLHQGRKLMAMIDTVVHGLGQLDRLIPAVRDLGRRHAGYGVQPAHYQTVGAALLWTLQAGLGDGFTSDVKAAWTEAYRVLSGVMSDAATVT